MGVRATVVSSGEQTAPRSLVAMPSRYLIESARPDDDEALRALLRSAFMDGPMRLSLQREPDFFIGAEIGSLATTVIVARDTSTGAVVSTAGRAIRRAFIDGCESPMGYLSALRTRDDVRRTTLLARGYRHIKLLHADGLVPFYVTTILDGNEEARRILTSGRAGLPAYVPYGKLRTFMLPLYGLRRCLRGGGVTRGAVPEALPGALACLNRYNSGLQFAPAYALEDFGENSRMLHGLSAGDLYLCFRGREISGTMAVWNQNGFKQSVAVGYSRTLSAIRPALTLAAKFGLAPRLPRKGQSLPCLYAALISSRDSDAAVFQELLDAVLADWTNAGYVYLLLGLCDGHPFSPIVEKRSVMTIDSRIYVVYWLDSKPECLPSTGRIPHLEVATL
jgi:hypothetical protein